jgi:hypothetical protein
MHATVKQLREIVKGVDGAWVRRWKDGEIWVGIGPTGLSRDLHELHKRVTLSHQFRVVGLVSRAWVVEQET